MTTLAKSDLRSFLSELVQMPTINTEKATCKAAIDWVKYQLSTLPLRTTDFVANGSPGVVLSTRQTKQPKVLLHAHIDVTPASPDQFKLTERDGRYYGRGVFDMKFAIASYMQLLIQLGNELPNYDLALSLTADEEGNGGMHGARHLVETGWRPEVIINPDSTGNGQWSIQRAAKGAICYIVTATGQAAHGSRTWTAPNANLRLANFLTDLNQQFPREPCGDPEHAHTTLNIGKMAGGIAVNQVAATATAELDARVMTPEGVVTTDTLLQTTAERHEGIKWERLAHSSAVNIALDNPHLARLRGIMERITGVAPQLILSHGSSETYLFAQRNIPVLMFGPAGGNHHANNEWISISGFEQSAHIIRDFVQEQARVK